jgi:hypothetical protein
LIAADATSATSLRKRDGISGDGIVRTPELAQDTHHALALERERPSPEFSHELGELCRGILRGDRDDFLRGEYQ